MRRAGPVKFLEIIERRNVAALRLDHLHKYRQSRAVLERGFGLLIAGLRRLGPAAQMNHPSGQLQRQLACNIFIRRGPFAPNSSTHSAISIQLPAALPKGCDISVISAAVRVPAASAVVTMSAAR